MAARRTYFSVRRRALSPMSTPWTPEPGRGPMARRPGAKLWPIACLTAL